MTPRIAIVYYFTWGHIAALAQAEAEGIKAVGGSCDIFQLPETLPDTVLAKMHAAPKDPNIPVLEDPSTLTAYDGFLFGISTRYGNFPAQWKVFWDSTGGLWKQQAFWGKFTGFVFVTGGLGGGQESTAIAAMSTLAHHGMAYMPLGYKGNEEIFDNVKEVRGGSPWGAGTFSANDGSRWPTETELTLARNQGKLFVEIVGRRGLDAK